MISAGTTFVVMTALKLAAMGACGIALTSAFQYFHTFELKGKKAKKGGEDDVAESMREKARQIS